MDSEQGTPRAEDTVPAEHDQTVLYAAWCNSVVAAGHELVVDAQGMTAAMLAFWQSRVKEGLVTVQRVLECNSVESAMEIQLDYAKAALQAYVDQFAKIGSAVTRSGTPRHDIVKPASEEAAAAAG